MGKRKEYFEENMRFTKSELQDLRDYNDTFYYSLKNNSSIDQIKDGLSAASAILSIVCLISSATVLAVAGAITSVISSIDLTDRSLLMTVTQNGSESLLKIINDMNKESWTEVEIAIPWLEFVDEKIRIVQGNCYGQKYYKNGDWEDLDKNYSIAPPAQPDAESKDHD